MEEKDLISVILPIYKVEPYLEKCLKSVMKQTYSNIEIILVNDGSPDNCGKICEEYAQKDKRIMVIHKENGGLSDARNVGIQAANGKYITLVDSDDSIQEDYVAFLYQLIQKNQAQMSICSHTVFYENGTILKKETQEHSILDAKTTLERILYDEGIDLSAWAKMYEKSLFDKVQYPKGRIFEDAATTYLLIDKCEKIAIGSESKYNYIIRNHSITSSEFSPKKMQLITSTKEMHDYIKSKYPMLAAAANRRLMYAYLSTLSQLANCNKRYPSEETQLVQYIQKNGKEILKDKRAKRRDKIGIISLKFGFPFYCITWRVYTKLTGRK